MDVFNRKSAYLLVIAFASGGATLAQQQQAELPGDIDLVFNKLEYNGNTNRIDLEGVTLTQGDIIMSADRASADQLDFGRSEWVLEGNVRIAGPTIRIEGRSARFSFLENELQRVELEGDPASFEATAQSEGNKGRGAANYITYDTAAGELSLVENARIGIGANEVMGCDLIYDIDDVTFRSGSRECDQPFRIRISPEQEESGANGAAEPRQAR